MNSRLAMAATFALSCQPALAQEAAPDLSRAARGDVRAPGGARRLPGDMRATYARLAAEGDVRNVILLIGDGMGDSEITLARNYAEGAGAISRASTLCPSPANTPITRSIAKPANRTM